MSEENLQENDAPESPIAKKGNPRVKRDYLDINKKGEIATAEDSTAPVIIRFYKPGTEEREYVDLDTRAYKALSAFATCHGFAQVAGDKFNKEAIGEDGIWSWDNIESYLAERDSRFTEGKWGMVDPGEGTGGKSAQWKLAFDNILARAVAEDNEAHIEGYCNFLSCTPDQLADPSFRKTWINETATDEQKAAVRDGQPVDEEKKRMAVAKAAPETRTAFDVS